MHCADVLIAGAGPAGAATALFLARSGVRVAIIDKAHAPAWRPPELLPPATHALLLRVGLHHILQACAARPAFGVRRIWGAQRSEIEDFFTQPGSSAWFVDRMALDLGLRAEAMAAGASVHPASAIEEIVRTGADWTIALAGSASLRADFLIDATGRSASLARRMGAGRLFTDKLVASASLSGGMAGWLDVEAHAEGWSYVADGISRVEVGGGRGAGAAQLRLAASSTCLDMAAGVRWMAVGDAACAFDPIASQGLSQAMASARAAADVIIDGAHRERMMDYSAAVQATWLHSERLRHEIYAAEPRWPDAPFWRGRTQAAQRFAAISRRFAAAEMSDT